MFTAGEKLESGHYTVVKELGQGGMGVVYHCHDELLQRDVAIKFLLPEITLNKETLEGFVQEARLAAQLEHPNIVTIYDIGKEERQGKALHYMAMEYLMGGNLASRIMGRQLSVEHCLNWMKQLANGLAYAHKRGIVHQDIKADNIFITTEGDLKIGDFGLARLAAGRAKGARSGHHGMGTPAYMSPELCRGDPQDHRSDIYSMGILFYEMATGQLPFKARGMIEMAMKHASAPVPSSRKLNPQVPDSLDKVVQKMMAKQPTERHQSMADVLAILDDLIFELRVARLGLGPKPTTGAKPGSGFFQSRTGHGGTGLDEPSVATGEEAPAGQEPLVATAAFVASGSAEPAVEQEAVPEATPVVEKEHDLPVAPAGRPAQITIPKRHLELLWAFHSHGPIGWKASPVANREETIIYCGSSDGNIYALDASHGTKLWTFETRGPVLSSSKVLADRVISTSADGAVYAIAATTGSQLWKYDLGSPVVSTAGVYQDSVLVSSMEGRLKCLATSSGTVKWTYQTGDAIVTKPEIINPTVFIGSKDEHVYAISLQTGGLKWKYRTYGPVVTAPVGSVDSIYVGSFDGSIYALDAETGRLAWRYETNRPILANGVIHFTTVIFCGQDRWLYCFEKYDGHLVWKAPVRGRVVANLVSFGSRIYVVTREGWVQSFDSRNGELKWQMDTKRRLESAPLVTGDVLYQGTVDGDVLAFSLAEGLSERSA